MIISKNVYAKFCPLKQAKNTATALWMLLFLFYLVRYKILKKDLLFFPPNDTCKILSMVVGSKLREHIVNQLNVTGLWMLFFLFNQL